MAVVCGMCVKAIKLRNLSHAYFFSAAEGFIGADFLARLKTEVRRRSKAKQLGLGDQIKNETD